MADPNGRSPGNSNALLAAAIVAAALIVSWNGGDEPRYQLAASGAAVYRMDTDSGEIIACQPSGCARVEAPDRAKTLGPISFSIGDDAADRRRVPAPQDEAGRPQP